MRWQGASGGSAPAGGLPPGRRRGFYPVPSSTALSSRPPAGRTPARAPGPTTIPRRDPTIRSVRAAPLSGAPLPSPLTTTPELERRLACDREQAKALLAEAGYPTGFEMNAQARLTMINEALLAHNAEVNRIPLHRQVIP